MPWEETDDYIHSGHKNPEEYDPESMRTIEIDANEGIKAIIGCPKGKFKNGKCQAGTEVQSFLFSKEQKWTLKKAKIWFNDHK